MALLAGFGSTARDAGADGGPAPLFLAPRAADDISLTDSTDVQRASRQRMAQRAAAVSSPNLKWKPYRPAQQQQEVSFESRPADDVPAGDIPTSHAVPASKQPTPAKASRSASKIAASADERADERPARRTAARASRTKFRNEILQVSQKEPSGDPFGSLDMSDDTLSTDTTPPADSQPEQGAPRTIPPSEEPFPGEETLPMPSTEQREFPAPETTEETLEESSSCAKDKRDCAAALTKLKSVTIDKININIAVAGQEGLQYPCECELNGVFVDRNWESKLFTWKASALCHKPLYFEEVALERYGHSLNPLLQPIFSGVHFFATVPILPYLMGVYPPNECQYVLGYYRMGDCAPWLVPPFPFSLRGAVVEAGVLVGGIFLVH